VQHVALLRGIAPSNPKMRNAEMVNVLGRAGLDEVEAVISSGNYIFESDERDRSALEDRIEAALADHLGAPCAAIVRSRRQIDGLCEMDAFEGYDDGPTERCNVTFLKRRPSGGEQLPSSGSGFEVIALQRNAVFFVVDTTRSKTPDVMSKVETAFGKDVTTRTWKTVHRIKDRFVRQ
jgi:uncharacterized protein (DUF1697 family)